MWTHVEVAKLRTCAAHFSVGGWMVALGEDVSI